MTCTICGDTGVRNVEDEGEAYVVGSYTVPCECRDGMPAQREAAHPWTAPEAKGDAA